MATLAHNRSASSSVAAPAFHISDLLGLIGGALIIVAYVVFPLRSDFTQTNGLGYLDAGTTFPALTLVAGIAAVLAGLVNMTAMRDRSARWYYVGLGVYGLLFLVDNTLRNRPALAIGGILSVVGSVVLIAQVFLPRAQSAEDAAVDRTQAVILGLIRVLIGTLWFTQLLWKLPWNNYGCPPGALVPAANTSGLCDWIGREIASPRYALYRDFLVNIVTPNLALMAPIILLTEAFIAFSLMLGLFARLGGLTALGMGINLFVGLTAVAHEWDWTYLMLPAMGAVVLAAGGRYFGVDAWLHRLFAPMAEAGNPVGRVLAWLTR
jgi:hypothetical protein